MGASISPPSSLSHQASILSVSNMAITLFRASSSSGSRSSGIEDAFMNMGAIAASFSKQRTTAFSRSGIALPILSAYHLTASSHFEIVSVKVASFW